MDKNLIEKYKTQLLEMYGNTNSNTETQAPSPPAEAAQNTTAEPSPDNIGKLIAVVTTLRALYPLENATVTVFKGDYDNMQVVARGSTDQSGRTEEFILETPSKELSLTSGAVAEPFARYNMLVSAEGYLDNIHLNIPVFSGVTSIQASNMMLLETAGINKGPQVFDEAQVYGLD